MDAFFDWLEGRGWKVVVAIWALCAIGTALFWILVIAALWKYVFG